MPAEFQWLRPEWLLAVPAIVLLAVLLARGKLGPGSWKSVVDPELLPFVLSRIPGRGRDYRWWLLGLCGTIAAVALAGPVWQRIEQPVFRAEQALVLALDLSRSMDAQDVAPSRIARAKLKILDILERRKSGQTALLVYSANAFTVTPLTDDTDTIALLVNSLSTDIMPSRGSYPEVAIRKGRQLLDQASVGYGEVLLITDGGSSPAATEAARDLKAAGYTLSVLGVGTIDGAPIPRASGGFVTDNRGRIAVPRLEISGLRALAQAGGGRYSQLSADTRDLDFLLAGKAAGIGAVASTLVTDRWREEGPWLLLLLLPLAALAFRRGWVLVAVIFIVPLPQPAVAASWNDLWLNKDQQAQAQLANGEAAIAAELFENSDWQAVARYRAGDYAGSAAQFAAGADTRNLYNLGNAMALQGEFDSAIDVYEQVLEIEPDNDDAQYNLELVKGIREQQQQQGDGQQSDENSGGAGERSDSASQPDQQGPERQSRSDSQQSDSVARDAEEVNQEDMQALRDELQRAAEEAQAGEQPRQLSAAELAERRRQQEKQQAMEQWLRRVPDDPGGLLRRKFRYQYQRSGKDQDGNSIWPDNEAQPW
ncbi:MAG: VWA domain-containing protein [Proteobacteria bacterium]|nr:VWA domain-containing protein [Pseudomonadota bacterium]